MDIGTSKVILNMLLYCDWKYMNNKKIKIIYWISTIVFSLILLADGYGGITKQQAGVDVFNHLGYPVYLLIIAGYAKVFAAFAILQTRFITIKEWAYAGFAISCYGAFLSRIFVGDTGIDLIFPIIFFAIMLVPYLTWKFYYIK